MASQPAAAASGATTEVNADQNYAARHVAAFFEKFERDRYECMELLAYASTHWLLSTEPDFKSTSGAPEPPHGLVTQMSPLSEFRAMFLLPADEGIRSLDTREVHQIVKELTYGIFVFNQLPTISLEANFDQSSACQMPPAYHDTRVGQVLVNVDYALKALWHGAYFPRDKRIKFSERWRNHLDVNANGKPETRKQLLTEFLNAGRNDSKDIHCLDLHNGSFLYAFHIVPFT